MTLRWKEFEKRAKRLVRAEVKRSPKLKEQKRASRTPRHYDAGLVAGFVVMCAILAHPAFNWSSAGPAYARAALAISLTGAVFFMTASWRTKLLASEKFDLLAFYPTNSTDVFRLLARDLIGPTAMAATAIITVHLALVFWKVFTPGTAALLGLGQTALFVALVIHLLAYWPNGPWVRLGFAGTMGWAVATTLWQTFGSPEYFSTGFTIALPTAWAGKIILAATGGAHWLHLIWLAPILLILATAPRSFRRLRANAIGLFDFRFIAQHQLESEAQDMPAQAMGPSELEEETLSGNLYDVPTPARPGFIERLAPRTLSPRQKLIAEFLWMPGPSWTRVWKAMGLFLGAAGIFVHFTPNLGWSLEGSLVVAGLGALMFFPLLDAFPLSGAPRGVSGWRGGINLSCPFFAGFPISYADLFWTMLKTNCIRVALCAPWLWAFAAAMSWKFSGTPNPGGFEKYLVTIFLLQPLVVTAWISRSMRARGAVAASLYILGVLAILAIVIWSLMALTVDEDAPWILFGALALVCAIWPAAHLWLYRSGRFELNTFPKAG